MLDFPLLVQLFVKILELITDIAGEIPEVTTVFNALIAFFGG